MIAQISNGKLTAKSSTRLTEVYWEIQPADDSDYWPLADETGTEYILFTSRDGSIGYYKEEEGCNTYSKHSLGIQGSITSMIAIPIRIKSYKGTAFICVKSADESQQFYRINIANGELKYIALEQREEFKPVRVAGGMCMATGQALAWFLYDVIGNPKPSM